MDERIRAACRVLGLDPAQLLTARVYTDRVVVVVNRGQAGYPKHSVLLGDLPVTEPEPSEPVVARKRSRGR